MGYEKSANSLSFFRLNSAVYGLNRYFQDSKGEQYGAGTLSFLMY